MLISVSGVRLLQVCTIDPMTSSFDPSPLIPYVEGLGLKYHYIKDDSESNIAFASWMNQYI